MILNCQKIKIYIFVPQYLFKYSPDFLEIIKGINNLDSKSFFVFFDLSIGNDKNRLVDILSYDMGNNIMFLPKIKNHEKFVYFLKKAHIILDTYPFGGCNTSLEAFSVGTPVITMPSKFLNGRFTYGFYQKMGIYDCIANSKEEYVKLAVKCFRDLEFYNNVKKQILNKNHLLFHDNKSVDDWTDIFNNSLKPFQYNN